jgi:hypothetical protein
MCDGIDSFNPPRPIERYMHERSLLKRRSQDMNCLIFSHVKRIVDSCRKFAGKLTVEYSPATPSTFSTLTQTTSPTVPVSEGCPPPAGEMDGWIKVETNRSRMDRYADSFQRHCTNLQETGQCLRGRCQRGSPRPFFSCVR